MNEQERQIVFEAKQKREEEDRAFTKFHKFVYTMLMVVLFGCLTTLGIWWAEGPPYSTYDREIITPYVKQGGFLKLHVQVTWTKTCYSRLRRNIVYANGVVVPYEREIRLNKAGKRDFVITQELPYDAFPGPARWVVMTDWFCNPLQYFLPKTVEMDQLEFTILPKDTPNEGKFQEVPRPGSCMGGGICKSP